MRKKRFNPNGAGWFAAVFGAGFALTVRSSDNLLSVCLYDLQERLCAAALRREADANCGVHLDISGNRADLYGHVYSSKKNTPLLFDVVLTDGNGQRYPRANGRVFYGSVEYIFAPGTASAFVLGNTGRGEIIVTPNGFLQETAFHKIQRSIELRGTAALLRFPFPLRLLCAAGHIGAVPFIAEKIR